MTAGAPSLRGGRFHAPFGIKNAARQAAGNAINLRKGLVARASDYQPLLHHALARTVYAGRVAMRADHQRNAQALGPIGHDIAGILAAEEHRYARDGRLDQHLQGDAPGRAQDAAAHIPALAKAIGNALIGGVVAAVIVPIYQSYGTIGGSSGAI